MPELWRIRDKALEARPLTDAEAVFLVELPRDRLAELYAAASMVKERFFGRRAAFCAIVNIKSGRCSQDCTFCAQSSFHDTQAAKHGFIGMAAVLQAGRDALGAGVRRLGLVASGLAPDAVETDEFSELLGCIRALRGQGLTPDVSIGLLDNRQLLALKAAGTVTVHHNLETSRSYFPAVCTTHSYEDDVDTVRRALKTGLGVCSGGIFGIGEGWGQRLELARTLWDLGVASIPLNFLTPIPGTPLEHRPLLSRAEALHILAVYRLLLPDRHLRVCGGRQAVFGDAAAQVWQAGASGVMTGNYLTTAGVETRQDMADAVATGLIPE